MAGHKNANINWRTENEDGSTTWDHAKVAILMDIRTELKNNNDLLQHISRKLNALECPKFVKIPRVLNRIANSTAKKRKPKKEKS